MSQFLLPPWPSFTEEEIDAVASVLRSNGVNYWTGQECREFEKEFADWCGTSRAVALTNGTVALDLALRGIGVGPGDEVIVTPRSFIASASSVVNVGAIPVFADVDFDSGNISPETINSAITDRTRAIIPVHLAGWPCDMEGIMALARANSLKVVEDCAQAHGASIGGRNVGSFGHVGAWSFCQDKIMTTGGEGGMVTTDDTEVWSTMWSYKDHGKSWNAVYGSHDLPGFRWVHESFGTNWRMLEVQAAIGRIQLHRLPEWTQRRTAVAERIRDAVAPFNSALRMPTPPSGTVHAYYRQYGYVRPSGLKRGWPRDRIVAECQKRGVPVMQGSCSEIYLEKAFDNTPWRPEHRLPVARELGETSLSFLCHPTITDDNMQQICSNLEEVLEQATT